MINKILVGVDGSENSEKALDKALEIAEKFSASVLLLNVFQQPPEFDYDPNLFQQAQVSGQTQVSIGYYPIIGEFKKLHEAVLSRAIQRATKLKPELKITAELKEGNTASQIVETATNGEFDLIVIGHMGEGRVKEFFLGSTTERVAHHAKCSVLITK